MSHFPVPTNSIDYHIWVNSTKEYIPDSCELIYRAYLKSPAWFTLRRQTFVRDGHRCTRCGYIGNQKHAHHIHYDGIYLLDFKLEQLETVCTWCHTKIHAKQLPMKG